MVRGTDVLRDGGPGYASRGRAAARRARLLDGHNLDARGRVPVQIGHRSRNALEQEVYPGSGASDAGGELNMTMPPRPRSCADRPPTSFLGARGSLVDAWVHACCRLVRAAWMHGCTCGAGAQRAPAAANPVWCRVERACSARAEDAVVTGLARRGVREHQRHAGEAAV